MPESCTRVRVPTLRVPLIDSCFTPPQRGGKATSAPSVEPAWESATDDTKTSLFWNSLFFPLSLFFPRIFAIFRGLFLPGAPFKKVSYFPKKDPAVELDQRLISWGLGRVRLGVTGDKTEFTLTFSSPLNWHGQPPSLSCPNGPHHGKDLFIWSRCAKQDVWRILRI
ncbi:hypothetical protein AVEN_101218-1 [Araneus ventricosus]|uniref:Uncharacterized protein n=1 Tax=Araneus ventricosus TaxID=182803 RepID=A0A4Y2FVD9_ARAVE|nr:hypothetical protein AVEN_101218-1 [Araneus ventricosus]